VEWSPWAKEAGASRAKDVLWKEVMSTRKCVHAKEWYLAKKTLMNAKTMPG